MMGRKRREIADLKDQVADLARRLRGANDAYGRLHDHPERVVHQPFAAKPFAVEVDGPCLRLGLSYAYQYPTPTEVVGEFDTLDQAVRYCGKQCSGAGDALGICTRRAGHTGRHAAGGSTGEVVAVWSTPPEPCS